MSDIFTKIVQDFKDRNRKDIQDWRQAIQMAELPEKPMRNALINLIDNLLTDAHISSQIELRKAATLNATYQLVDDKGGQHELTSLFTQPWFYHMVSDALDTPFLGHSLFEFSEVSTEKIEYMLIPRSHVVPNDKQIIPDFSLSDIRLSYEGMESSVIELGKVDDLGLLNKVVPNLIWKRNAQQAWAEFADKFGMPLVTAELPREDSRLSTRTNEMLLNLVGAGVGSFAQGTKIQFQESKGTDAYKVYLEQINLHNSEMSKVITGGTMLSDDGSSRSQSEVHERNLEYRIALADRRLIASMVNFQLLPLLRSRGINIPENVKFEFVVHKEVDLEQQWTIAQGLMTQYELDSKWIEETFSVPIVAKKTGVEPKPNSVNASMERYPTAGCCPEHGLIEMSDFSNEALNEKTEELLDLVWRKKNTDKANLELLDAEFKQLLKALEKGWNNKDLVKAAWDAPDHLAHSFVESNLVEFANSKVQFRHQNMKELFLNKKQNRINTFEEFKEQFNKKASSLNTNYLKAEYNLVVQSARSAANFYRDLANQEAIPYIQYQTIGDNNVRNAHQILNGKIFALNDHTARSLYPPNGWNCRCEMLPYPYDNGETKKISGTRGQNLLGDSFKDSEFNVNRAEQRKVFNSTQMYIADSMKSARELMNKNTYKSYGLDTIKTMAKEKKKLVLDDTITEDNYQELFKPNKDGVMEFKDYHGRKHQMTEKSFTDHTKGKYLNKEEQRHRLFPHVKEVLTQPDEVWLKEYKAKELQKTYVKVYNNETLVVDTHVKDDAIEVKTWYNVKRKLTDEKVRKGIKIK